MSASQNGVGYYVGLSGGQSDLDREGKDHVNASVIAGGDMNIVVGGDAAIRGANLEAENIRAEIGGDLHVASIADTGSADGERWSAGVTIGIGTASGVSGSYGETEGEKDWIAAQTSIVGRNEVDINVGNHTQLDAALIASETGNLRLETETFAYTDHYGVDREESYDIGFGLSGFGGGPANQQSGAGANDSVSNWSLNGGYNNRDRRQTVRATIGDGEIIVRADAENGNDSTSGLNRDVEKAYEITKDESDSYEVYVSTSALRKIPELTEIPDQMLEAYSQLGQDAFKLIKKLFPGGLSPEQAQQVSRALFENNPERARELLAIYKGRGLSDSELQLVEEYFRNNITGLELAAGLSEESRNAITVEIGLFFDGTGNNKYVDELKGEETNVARLSEMYRGDSDLYLTGVGTDGWIDYFVCGLTGCGALDKVDESINFLSSEYEKLSPDETMILVIDTAGFSRGAATDRTFVNEVLESGIPGVPDEMIYVRSEVLFDTVGSMGAPGNDIDAGHNYAIPGNVGFAFSLIAGNEYRDSFDLQSVRYSDGSLPANAYEESFPGAHSDEGGGYAPGEDGKSNTFSLIPLRVARQYAAERGVPYSSVPSNYQVPDELEIAYSNYQNARSAFEMNPTSSNRVAYESAYSVLESGYLHDSRPLIKQLPIIEDRSRTVYYPNDQLR